MQTSLTLELCSTLNDIQEDINHWQSQPPRKRFGRIIRNAQPIQEYRMRLDRALVVFNVSSLVGFFTVSTEGQYVP